MPTAAIITLTASDGVTTHAYAPQGDIDGVFAWKNTESTTSLGRPSIKLSHVPANAKRRIDKVPVSLAVPVENTVDGVVVVTDTFRFNGEFIIPSNATDAQRADFVAYVESLVADPMVSAYAKDLTPAY